MIVMLVDDSRSSLYRLRSLVEQLKGVRVRSFDDSEAALLAAHDQKFDIVIVDHIMPKIDGIEFIRLMRAMTGYEQIPIVMFTATNDQQIRLSALDAGATDFLAKSMDSLEFKVRFRNLALLSETLRKLDDHVISLAHEVERATKTLLAREEEMIFRLSKAVEYRDNDTGDHTLRVARYSKMIADNLGLSPQTCHNIYLASPLHDIGKVAIPDTILLKPGALDPKERAVISSHAAIGEVILGGSASELIRLAAEIAGNHHERWDGKGYPRQLAGYDIPLCARIVAVADVFDALTTERPYKKAMSIEDALSFLEQERDHHFDPACVDAFLSGFTASEQRMVGDRSSAAPFPMSTPGVAAETAA